MSSQFDEIVDFSNSNGYKWNFLTERGYDADAIALWVADMDFRSPQPIIDAVVAAAQRGLFGYAGTKRDYFDAVASWMQRRYGWAVEEEWLVKTPGVVTAFSAAIRGCTQTGDAVLIQPPVYMPFHSAVKLNDRKLVFNQLLLVDGRYEIDFEDFERKVVDEHVRMFILCNPANPVGRAWSLEELTRMGDICVRHNVIVVSDEIHQDLVMPGHQHHVFAGIRPEFSRITITCTAPSKTFSVAGLHTSNVFVEDASLRRQLNAELMRAAASGANRLGLVACQAGYEHGEPWLQECVEYIDANARFVRAFMAEHMPQIKTVELEATYLMWLDCRELGLTDHELERFFTHRAKLALNMGHTFGPGGGGHVRMNVACPRSVLATALERLQTALSARPA
jgi:cystathionine beta-lyase